MTKNWEEFIGMKSAFVGHDVIVEESGMLWRGPFKDVRLVDGVVILETEWAAEELHEGTFRLISDGPFGINRLAGSEDWVSWWRRGNTVIFSCPMIGRAYIHLDSTDALNRETLRVE